MKIGPQKTFHTKFGNTFCVYSQRINLQTNLYARVTVVCLLVELLSVKVKFETISEHLGLTLFTVNI